MEFFFEGHWRMDWGLGNPNKTAVLIATVMIAVWGLAFYRKGGFWLAFLLNAVLGACLLQTYSRGGIIAAGAGLALLGIFSQRPWPRKQLVAISMGMVFLLGFCWWTSAWSRFSQGMIREDPSITHRLEIWKAAPRMILDAPGGWGLGKSGQAYTQWYQPFNRDDLYRTLVNSHLTWLVELSWAGRFLYILGWLTVFLLCFPSLSVERGASSGMRSIPLGIWTVFGIGAFFSSVGESPWLWLIPGISLLAVLITRWVSRDWPRSRSWGWVIGWVLAAVALILALGGTKGEIEICKEPGFVIVRPSPYSPVNGKKITLVAPDSKILGEHYGHTIRTITMQKGWHVTVLDDFRPNRVGKEEVVFMGDGRGELSSGPLIIKILNPCGKPPVSVPAPSGRVTIYWGEFFQTEFRPQWETWAHAHGFAFQPVAGEGEYLANWTVLLGE